MATFPSAAAVLGRVVTLHNEKTYKKPLSLTDIIVALIEMDLAHQESAKKSERVRAAYDARRRAGKVMHTSANCPRWLHLIDRERFEPIPERVALVREIFELSAAGEGQFRIAKRLNARGEPTWGGTKFWHASNLHKLIESKMVLGFCGEQAGYFPAVVDVELWQRANDRIVRRGTSRGTSVDEANLLRGLAFSSLDGSPMVHRRGATATPEIRKIHNRIAYLRAQLKVQNGKPRCETEAQLNRAIADRVAANEAARIAGRSSYEYRYQRLASMATISGAAATSHWVDYQSVEQRTLWLIQNAAPEILSAAVAANEKDREALKKDVAQRLKNAEHKIAKLVKIFEADDAPSTTLIDLLKSAERDAKACKAECDRLNREVQSANETPSVSEEDLASPEGRRRVRAQIARWCKRIEISKTDVAIWFSNHTGIACNLDGEPYSEILAKPGSPYFRELLEDSNGAGRDIELVTDLSAVA